MKNTRRSCANCGHGAHKGRCGHESAYPWVNYLVGCPCRTYRERPSRAKKPCYYCEGTGRVESLGYDVDIACPVCRETYPRGKA